MTDHARQKLRCFSYANCGFLNQLAHSSDSRIDVAVHYDAVKSIGFF